MVENNIACPSCREDNQFFENFDVSWEELQGLSWFFCENCSEQQTNDYQKISFTCA